MALELKLGDVVRMKKATPAAMPCGRLPGWGRILASPAKGVSDTLCCPGSTWRAG